MTVTHMEIDDEKSAASILGNRPVEEVIYYRQNRKGKPLKISREKYLRSDINCGALGCDLCPVTKRTKRKLDKKPPVYSTKFNFQHYLMPDVGFILRQVDVLESLSNVILLQSVMEEVWQRNVTTYKRVREGVANRKWLYYLNEHSRFTYAARKPDESQEERDERALFEAYKYFQEHLAPLKIKIVLLSDNPEFSKKVESFGKIKALYSTGEDYVSCMTSEFKDLEDKLCRVPYNEDEAVTKYSKGDFSYPPHLDHKAIQDGIKAGKMYQGAYRSFNFYEGCVRIDTGEERNPLIKRKPGVIDPNEVLLQGLDNINRASEGDIVCIEILPEDQWSVPSGMIVEEAPEVEPELVADEIVRDKAESVEPDAPEEEKKEEDEIFSAVAKLADKKDLRRKTGKLVGIIRRKWKPCCGIIRKSLNEGSRFHFFVPDNKKLPRIRIETRNVDRFAGQKLVAQIDQWPVTSRYPVGHVVKTLGTAGSLETETAAILYEHGVPHDPFSKAVEACLPSLPFVISEEERQRRKDFRDITIVSVDPPGCTDIDDALHCNLNPDGTFEVGVHIADVSHFVRPGTALDAEAARRCTTVYLADRRIDMIPNLLSSNLCSLHSGTEKLVFSVIWKLNADAEILDTKFYKGIINSKAAMTYAEAQARLNSTDSSDVITMSLKRLNCLAQILKKKRIAKGALQLSAAEVNEEGQVEDECEESHSLVEEFMLLANISVATFILDNFTEYALLRRHPVPPPTNFGPLLLAAKAHNINIIVDQGSKALNDSIEMQAPEIKTILRVLTTRCMTQALYFCSGTTSPDEYLHFGLAARLYTHFTSPIRRYADLMVHRLLAIALDYEKPDQRILSTNKIHEVCDTINIRHRMAQYASRASHNIFKSQSLQGKKEQHHGYIMFVKRNALQVYVPNYAMEGYIFFPEGLDYQYNEQDGYVQIGSMKFHSLDKLLIGLTLEESKGRVVFKLISPKVPGLSEDEELETLVVESKRKK